jgi:hypothetical protein
MPKEAAADDWYDGEAQFSETPPPLPLQPLSVGGNVDDELSVVPPTAVTYGWLAGSSVASWVSP